MGKLTLLALLSHPASAVFAAIPGDAAASVPTMASYRSLEESALSGVQPGIDVPQGYFPDPAGALYTSDPELQDTTLGHIPWSAEDAWITDIGMLLFSDQDQDGYYTGFSLTLDADTRHNELDVYVSLDIQRTFAQSERLHISDTFTLYGNSPSDEYRIEIELVQHYPAGLYDVRLTLHDAYDHRQLDSISAADFTNLSDLPLESEELDFYLQPGNGQQHPDSSFDNDDIRVIEHAGSAGWLLATSLFLVLLQRVGPTSMRRWRPSGNRLLSSHRGYLSRH
ncbi:MAG: hypothetical protein HKN42_13055 [Granulosicoccus sp.]|nr:hypothetical protein [Granulosicoccus sp.]